MFNILKLALLVKKIMKSNLVAFPSGKYRVGDIRHAISDISKLKNFGWRPTVSEVENIREFVEWVKYLKPKKEEFLLNLKKMKKKVKVLQSSSEKTSF